MLFDGEMFRKIQEQVVAGHGPACEESLGHPTLVEVVRKVLVRKDVDEQLPSRLEEPVDLFEEVVVVLHVLEPLVCPAAVRRKTKREHTQPSTGKE